MLPGEEIISKQQPNLQILIQQEKLLFSREIEEFYSIEQKDVKTFVNEQLTTTDYEMNEIFGEK